MRLGDAVILFGKPLASVLWCTSSWHFLDLGPNLSGNDFLYEGRIFFQGNIQVDVLTQESQFDPQMLVTSITYYYPADEPPYRFDTPPWQGFVRVDVPKVCTW
jgi:hypothetical protein